MGREVGWVTLVEPMPADDQWARENQFNIYVEFVVLAPHYGYLWVDSRARVMPSDLLGNRAIEVTRGTDGMPTYRDGSIRSFGFWKKTGPVEIYDAGGYQPVTDQTKGFWLLAIEPPTFNDRADALLTQAEEALPNLLSLTNQLAAVLTNGANTALNLDALLAQARPTMTNLNEITTAIRNPRGGLGEWLLPTNLSDQLFLTLDAAENTLQTTDQQLGVIATNLAGSLQALTRSLDQLSALTGTLNREVQSNTNILGQISSVVTNTDAFIQGLRTHWFIKSAFKEEKPKKR
jgi:hypothetical protein